MKVTKTNLTNNESMKVTKTNLTNKVVLGSVTSKKQRKGLRIVWGIELLTTFTWEKMVHLSIKTITKTNQARNTLS